MKNSILRDEILGSYLPGYFTITVNSDTDFKTMSQQDRSTLIHEYIHFLQNISTVSGLTILSYIGSWVGHVTHGIYNNEDSGERVRHFPYYGENSDSSKIIEDFDSIIISLYGDGEKSGLNILSDHFGVSKVTLSPFSENELFDEDIPMPERLSHSSRCLVEYSYLHNQGNTNQVPNITVDVGAICIYEYMAHTIEKSLFDVAGEPPKTPYLVVRDVADFIFGYKVNDDILVAICELTLQSPFPGEEFYKILNGLNEGGYDLNSMSKRLLIECCNSNYYIQEDYDILSVNPVDSNRGMQEYTKRTLLDRQIEEVKKDFKVFFQGSADFDKAYDALTYLLDSMSALRGDDLLPISELMFLKNEHAVNYLNDIIRKIGMPLLFNENGYVGHAIAAKGCDEQFFLFFTLYQYLRVFKYGDSSCGLLNSCNDFQKQCVNENCHSNPHLKGKEELLCTLGQLIKTWGLNKYEFM
ncbi:hypothetical protein [Serratia proteamaculans]